MGQALSAAAIAAVVAACWVLGRPRPRQLSSKADLSAVALLNRGQMERVLARLAKPAKLKPEGAALALPAASDQRGRRQLLQQLERDFAAGGSQRQRAMATCERWGHRAALPLIQRGLRDSDPAVVALAASAMAHFRGRGPAAPATAQAVKPPRNVSRTR